MASLWHQIVSVSLAVAFWGEMGSVASRCAELLMARLTYSLCIQRSNLVKGLLPPAADKQEFCSPLLVAAYSPGLCPWSYIYICMCT